MKVDEDLKSEEQKTEDRGMRKVGGRAAPICMLSVQGMCAGGNLPVKGHAGPVHHRLRF